MVQIPKTTKGEKRRAAIIALARSVLIKDGYDRFILRDIAKRADMKLGNLQYYFATREALMAAIGLAELAQNLATLKMISSGTGTPENKVRRIVIEIITHWQQEGSKIFSVMSLLAQHQSQFAALHVEIYGQFYEILCDIFEGFNLNISRPVLMHKTRLVTALLDGALFQIPLNDDKNHDQIFLDELVEAIIKLIDLKTSPSIGT